jgi:hypothetical protein
VAPTPTTDASFMNRLVLVLALAGCGLDSIDVSSHATAPQVLKPARYRYWANGTSLALPLDRVTSAPEHHDQAVVSK